MCEMFGVGISFKWTLAVRRLFGVVIFKVSGIQKQSERQTTEFVVGGFQHFFFLLQKETNHNKLLPFREFSSIQLLSALIQTSS